MSVQTLTVARKKFAVIPYEDYQQLLKGVRPDETGLPPLPEALPGLVTRKLRSLYAALKDRNAVH